VVSPNGVGLDQFTTAIKSGKSGIEFYEELEELKFSCCIGGIPEVSDELKRKYFTDLQLRNFNSSGILYGCMAGTDAWHDAGLEITDQTDYQSGTIFGAGTTGVDKFRESIYKLDSKKVRRLGSTAVAQTMASGVSAYLGGILGLGNQVTSNSSACTTGTEAILMGYERVKAGRAERMVVGSTSEHGPYVWGGFDAIRVLTYKHNTSPTSGSRPMSETASGFVPGSGAGAMVVESLESATARNARIYAEILGGDVNSGGQRNEGTMTAGNSEAVQQCIKNAVKNCKIDAKDIDTINGHLTATTNDYTEINNWSKAIEETRQTSDWTRHGYLDKVFTLSEQLLIAESSNAFTTVWRLWSMKESAYKVYIQSGGHRSYSPTKLECSIVNDRLGRVKIGKLTTTTSTDITSEYIYTTAAIELHNVSHSICKLGSLDIKAQSRALYNQLMDDYAKTHSLNRTQLTLRKTKTGQPQLYYNDSVMVTNLSLTHHGKYGAYSIINSQH